MDDQQNSKSPSYHARLTPAEYGARLGLASQDIAIIIRRLESHGDKNYSSSSSAVTMLNVSSTLATTIAASDIQGDQSSVKVALTV
jgi:hypothetical protein